MLFSTKCRGGDKVNIMGSIEADTSPRGGGGLLGGNFGTDVPPDTLKHTLFIYLVIEKRDPFIYHAFEKSDPFIYLIVQNFYLYTIIYKYFDFLSCVCQQKVLLNMDV